MKLSGFASSGGVGSRRYDSKVSVRFVSSDAGPPLERYVKKRDMMIARVVNSEGPLCSSEKRRFSKVGKRVTWMAERRESAAEVVQRALRQRRVSCSRVSSCSSLQGCQYKLAVKV
jgi:hypothetical protein